MRERTLGQVTALGSRWGRYARGSTLLLACLLPACEDQTPVDPNAMTIGLLLPFTGSESATASNFERAVLYARDRINKGGGIHKHQVRVVSADTHSDPTRAVESVKDLIDQKVVAVIGPESAEVAQSIRPYLDDAGVMFLSPVVGAADDKTVDCTRPWFRLAPSSSALGQPLAIELSAQSMHNVALLHSSDAYDQALSDAAKSRFLTLGGKIAYEAVLDPSAQSYSEQLTQVLDAHVDAVVLASSPRAAALVVNELSVLATERPRWFLSPLLKTDLLVQNVVPEALEGALGVAPKIFETSADFPKAFAERWEGDTPLEGAYFYYDAMALLSFALEAATPTGTSYSPTDLAKAIRTVAAPPGELVGWNDIETSLPAIGNGVQLYYAGLTGPMLLQVCGTRKIGQHSGWTVHNGVIENTTN